MTKIERIRSEHRGQWEDGLAKLVLAQKTMLSELSCRQHRETRQCVRASVRVAADSTARLDSA